MALLTKAPRGTQDVLPADSAKWQYVESTLLETAKLFGFQEIRVPTFEHTELFNRSVGDTTDVVQKEMYTFEDKGNRSITLRPEGTAGVVRSVLEHSLLNEGLPVKACYILSCFRYEKPQAGRLREFHQFGAEVFGPADATADAQLISMVHEILETLGVWDVSLRINSIGCPKCRGAYNQMLKEYFQTHYDQLCPTCQERLDKNPMRILDCKSPVCQEIAKGAPKILDHICPECQEHFQKLQEYLTLAGIEFTVDPWIVRGLDYYTKTVFEFVSNNIGAQGTVCGGGRYDGLVKELGGADTPALGFGMGLERLLLVMEQSGSEFPPKSTCDLYIANRGGEAAKLAFQLTNRLVKEGYVAECDLMNRSLKAQMKYADKLGAKFSMVLGEDELASGTAKLKNMRTGESFDLLLGDSFVEDFYSRMIETVYEDLEDASEHLKPER